MGKSRGASGKVDFEDRSHIRNIQSSPGGQREANRQERVWGYYLYAPYLTNRTAVVPDERTQEGSPSPSIHPNPDILPSCRMEDLTNPELLRVNPKCDRKVSLYGYLRGAHLKNKSQVHMAGGIELEVFFFFSTLYFVHKPQLSIFKSLPRRLGGRRKGP